jgi:hypothetical protein
MIERAIGIIGDDAGDDHIVDPTAHAAEFRERAPGLAAILSTEAVRFLAGEYTRRDRLAIEAQSEFKRWAGRLNWLVFVSAVSTAALAAAGPLFEVWASDAGNDAWSVAGTSVSWMLAVVAATCGAMAGVAMSYLRSEKLLEKWMTRRAEAESLRLEYFATVTEPTENPPDSNLLLLQLEYFRRFQLGVELAFYGNRGAQHDRAARHALKTGLLLMMIVAVINAVAGTASGAWTALALLALVAQASAVRISGIEAVNQDGRNAERYGRTHSVLARIKVKLDQVRPAVAAGDGAVVTGFVEAVHEQLSLEHRQWLESLNDRHSAIGQLEQRLRQVDPAARGGIQESPVS